MENFRCAIFILFNYLVLSDTIAQYEETYEHQMRP